MSGKPPKGIKRILGGSTPTGIKANSSKPSGQASKQVSLRDMIANNPFSATASSSVALPKSNRAPKVDYKVRGTLPVRPL